MSDVAKPLWQVDPSAFVGKRVLITGGLGFIGSNLAVRLADLGAEVSLMDSLIPSHGGNLANIDDARDRVAIHIADLRDAELLPQLVERSDVVFNLAGQTSHLDSMTDPLTDLSINAASQLHLLEACRLHAPGTRVVFASTRQFYGRPRYLPVDEKHPLEPMDVNGVNKLAGEWYHKLYHDVYGLETTALRLTNTYGPRMRVRDSRQTFLGVWIYNSLVGSPIEVWGGAQLRDYTYVDDAVEAFLAVALADCAVGRSFNLGGVRPYTLLETAEKLVDVAGSGATLTIREFPAERKAIDIGDYYADYSLISSSLGWRPQVDLNEGLRRTMDYFRSRISAYV